MNIDFGKIDQTFPVLRLTLHDGNHASNSHDRDTMNRLHGKGLIPDPANAR